MDTKIRIGEKLLLLAIIMLPRLDSFLLPYTTRRITKTGKIYEITLLTHWEKAIYVLVSMSGIVKVNSATTLSFLLEVLSKLHCTDVEFSRTGKALLSKYRNQNARMLRCLESAGRIPDRRELLRERV